MPRQSSDGKPTTRTVAWGESAATTACVWEAQLAPGASSSASTAATTPEPHLAPATPPPPTMSATSALTTGCTDGLKATLSNAPAEKTRPSRVRSATPARRRVYLRETSLRLYQQGKVQGGGE